MSRITTFIPGLQKRYTVTGTSYGPATGEEGYFEWAPAKYDNIVAVYVEIVATTDSTGCNPNAIAGVEWELYDVTNSAQIGCWSSTGTNWAVRRSADISDSMPTSTATMRISWKKSCGTSATCSATRLIVVQENPTKTRSFISVGGSTRTSNTSYTTLGVDDKQWLWDADKFKTIGAVEYHATFKSSVSGRTASVKLDNLSETDAITTLNSSAVSYNLSMSGDISSALNSDTYRTYIKIANATASCLIANAYIVVDIIDLNKFITNLDIQCEGFFDTASSYSEESPFQAVYDNSIDFWAGVIKSIYHQACLHVSSATSAEAILFDDSVQISDSEISSTSSSMEVQKSSVLPEPADNSIIGYSLKQTGGGRGASARSSYSVITYEVIITNMQINISDNWKRVKEIQINVGDVWGDVNSVQINIGDAWKTVF